jgi:hypothetical protein
MPHPQGGGGSVSVSVTVACVPVGVEGSGTSDDLAAAVLGSLMDGCYESDSCRPFALGVALAGDCDPTPTGTARCVVDSIRGAPAGAARLAPATAYLWYALIRGLLDNARSHGDAGMWCAPVQGTPGGDPFVSVLVSVLTMIATDYEAATSPTARELLLGAQRDTVPAPTAAITDDSMQPWGWTKIPPRVASEDLRGDGGGGGGGCGGGGVWGALARLSDTVVLDQGRVCIGSSTITGSAGFHVATVFMGLAIIMWLVGQIRQVKAIVRAEREMH